MLVCNVTEIQREDGCNNIYVCSELQKRVRFQQLVRRAHSAEGRARRGEAGELMAGGRANNGYLSVAVAAVRHCN